MSLTDAVSLLTLIVDIGILCILWVEFNYDKIQDEKREYKEAAKKKRTKVVRTPEILAPADPPAGGNRTGEVGEGPKL